MGLALTILVTLALLAWFIYFTVGTVPGKTMAVAQAAYRESIRQPLFWFLIILFGALMFLSVFLPYFTFGEDLKMVKSLQLDAILLSTLIITVFTASVTIAEEIEGRTAITLMSKPVSRQQFLLGKFTGIFSAALLMALVLSVFMGWTIYFKQEMDRQERPPELADVVAIENALSFLPGVLMQAVRYVLLVFSELQALAPGVLLNACQVMIITALAVTLATRLPMVVNLVICLVVFFMGRLTHVLEAQSEGNPLVKFVAQVFSTLLPGLNYYDISPAIVSDFEVPWVGYVVPAALHGVIYTAIALLFGLILFEDRDLA
jgi:ABC-type Na+ efflux pump permease subunit